MRMLILLILLFPLVAFTQDSPSLSPSPQRVLQDSPRASPQRQTDSMRSRPRPDSIRRPAARDTLARDTAVVMKDSLAVADSLAKAMTRSGRLFRVPASFPSVYGSRVGGLIRRDKRFNAAGTVPVLRESLRVPPQSEWIFYLFCGVLLLLSFLRLAFFKYFIDLFRVFFNTSMRQKQIREQLTQSPLPSLLLNLFFSITGGIFLFFLLSHYDSLPDQPTAVNMLLCIGALALLYLGKYLFITLMGWIFDRRAAAENYLFVVFMVNKMAGLFLLPMTILLAYSSASGRPVLLTLALTGLVILALMRLVRGFQSVSSSLRINIVQFLIFSAAFEVIPVLLIYKVLMMVIA